MFHLLTPAWEQFTSHLMELPIWWVACVCAYVYCMCVYLRLCAHACVLIPAPVAFLEEKEWRLLWRAQ